MSTARRHRGAMSHHAGNAAELRIAQDYERRGFAVARRRWRSAAGEIDLILRNGDQMVFVEVKKSRSIAAAAQRLSARQMERICLSAQCYLADESLDLDTNMRIDVALLDATGAFEIVENAFGAA